MTIFKTTAAAATIAALTASTAYAGGMAEPIMTMEPEMVMEDVAAAGSSSGLLIPLILIALIAAASSSSSSAPVPLN